MLLWHRVRGIEAVASEPTASASMQRSISYCYQGRDIRC